MKNSSICVCPTINPKDVQRNRCIGQSAIHKTCGKPIADKRGFVDDRPQIEYRSGFTLPEPKPYEGYEIEVFESEGGCCGDKCTECTEIAEETEQSGANSSDNGQRSVRETSGTE